MRSRKRRGLFSSCGHGNMSFLSKVLSRTNKAWPLALHLSQTPEKMCKKQSFFNVAMPSGSSEYYIMALCKDDVAKVRIDQKSLDICLFHNVSVYNMDGSLWSSDYDSDSIVTINEELVEKHPEISTGDVEMIVKGPAILCARFYKPYTLLSLWALDIGILPKVILNDKPMQAIEKEESEKISNRVTRIIEKKIASSYDKKSAELPSSILDSMRENTWRTKGQFNFFIPLKGKVARLFPNIHSVYSFYHLQTDLALINIKFYNNVNVGKVKILFSDLMVCDTNTTRTDSSIPGDQYPNCKKILAYKESTPIPPEYLDQIKSGEIQLLQWRKDTTPLLIFRMVHINTPNSISNKGLKSDDIDEIACYLLQKQLKYPSIYHN